LLRVGRFLRLLRLRLRRLLLSRLLLGRLLLGRLLLGRLLLGRLLSCLLGRLWRLHLLRWLPCRLGWLLLCRLLLCRLLSCLLGRLARLLRLELLGPLRLGLLRLELLGPLRLGLLGLELLGLLRLLGGTALLERASGHGLELLSRLRLLFLRFAEVALHLVDHVFGGVLERVHVVLERGPGHLGARPLERLVELETAQEEIPHVLLGLHHLLHRKHRRPRE